MFSVKLLGALTMYLLSMIESQEVSYSVLNNALGEYHSYVARRLYLKRSFKQDYRRDILSFLNRSTRENFKQYNLNSMESLLDGLMMRV